MKWEMMGFMILLLVSSGCVSNSDDEKLNESNYPIPLEYDSVFIGIGSLENLNDGTESYAEIHVNSSELYKLEQDDDSSLLVQSWETVQEDGQPYLLVNFSVTDEINEVLIRWMGYGSQPFMGDVLNTVTILIFNHNSEEWDEEFVIEWEKGEDIKKRDILFNIDDLSSYLSDDKVISIIIFGPYGAGDSTGTLKTEVLYAKGKE